MTDQVHSTSEKLQEGSELPENWSTRKIGDVCQIFGRIGFRGYTVDDIVEQGQGAISLSPSNVSGGKLVLEKNTYISWEKWEESPEIKIVNGDIILVKTGSTVGKAAIVRGLHEEATLNPQMVVFKKRRINETLLGYVVTSEGFQTQLAATAVGGALPTLSQKEVAGYSFACPDDPSEQQAIAEALSDADGVVEGLERLIEKKRRIKQGAMQDLLTAKRRLPGFSGEWGSFRLAEHGKFLSGSGFPLIYQGHSSGDYPFFKVSDFSGKNNKSQLTDANHYISKATQKKIGARVFPAHSIAFAKIGAAIFLERKRMIAQESCLDNNMGAYVLQDPSLCAHLILAKFQTFALGDLVSSTALPAITSSDLKAIKFFLPKELNEQEALASTLIDMDAEITALKTRLQKARAIKEGMMQNLLTGRIRLV